MRICLFVFLFFLYVSAHAQSAQNFTFKNIPSKISNQIYKENKSLFDQGQTLLSLEKITVLFYKTGLFENISIYYEKGKFVVQAESIKNIARIKITGNKSVSQSQIETILGIHVGEQYNYQSIFNAAERLKDFYGRSGYFNSVINITPTPSSQDKILLEIQIQEGDPCIIKNIEFSTNHNELKQNLKKKLKKYTSKKITEDTLRDLEKDLRTYLLDDRILSANIHSPQFDYNENRTSVNITYALDDLYKYLILFEGNKFYSRYSLLNKLDLNNRKQLSLNPAAEFHSKIEALYKENGFPQVSIKTQESIDTKSYTRKILFQIQEGPQIFIRNIKFSGKISRPSSFYESLFKKHYNSKFYNPDIMKEAQTRFLEEMQNQGFLKGQFVSFQSNFLDGKNKADLHFFFNEGPQTVIKSIKFTGNKAYSKDQLLEVIYLKEDAPIHLENLEASFRRLHRFYTSKGFLDMDVQSDLSNLVKYNDTNTQAHVTFKIKEGPQVRVGNIIVEGNAKTRSKFIVNELEFDKGDILTPQKIEDSEYHIQKTGLFSQVEIVTVEKDTPIETRTVLIRVTERDPGLLNFGLGVNTEFEFTIRGYAGLAYNNISGKGRAASIRAEVKQVQDIDFLDHRITLGYLEPTLFAKRTRGRVTFIRAREITSRTDGVEDQTAKILAANRLSFILEKDFTRYFKLSHILWSISTNKEFLFPNEKVLERVNIASLGPIFEYDRRDHPFVTKKGFYTKLSVEYGDRSLGSSQGVHYLRNIAQVNSYMSLPVMDIVWANSVSGGYQTNLKDQDKTHIPSVKEFKLGGRDTIRGFEPNEIPGSLDKNGNPVYISKDSHYYLFKSELRIPVYGQIESVLFYDGGAVFIRDVSLRDDYRDSVGIGFRYQTPVGPLSLEYGFRLDRDRALDEPPGRFHLSFGMF